MRSANINSRAKKAVLEIENVGYAMTSDAIHTALTLAEAHLPPDLTVVRLHLADAGFRGRLWSTKG